MPATATSALNDLVSTWLADFAAALSGPTPQALERLFAADCYWRDLVAFTWNILTAEGRAAIMGLAVRAGAHGGKGWALKGDAKDGGKLCAIEASFTFETGACLCVGHLRLDAAGRCWTLLTAAEDLKGHPEISGPNRAVGRPYGAVRGRVASGVRRAQEKASLGMLADTQPFAVIVGGGQCGLAIAARLKRKGVPAIVLDRHERAGDCWRKRYDALHLHDPVWTCHLPFIPLPGDWPLYPSKDQLADFLEAYVQLSDLTYWASSNCLSAVWDHGRREWGVVVDRGAAAGGRVLLRPKHLILATGLFGGAHTPELESAELFEGDVFHSSEYKNGHKYAGKRAVVVGSNTSAHDIVEDLWEAGAASVTMVQRSGTMVTPIQTQLRTVGGDERVAAEDADLGVASVPYRVMTEMQKGRTAYIRAKDADFYRQLEAAGFRLDFGEDGSGNIAQFLRRGGGYYFDTGASALVISGGVKVVQGDVVGFAPSGVVLRGASSPIEADLVVLATGYKSFADTVESVVGADVSRKLGRVWGLGSGTAGDPGPWEGELRNMWKPTAQEGLWVQGGNLGFSRNFSKYLALQLQARFLGIPTPVYAGEEPAPPRPPTASSSSSSSSSSSRL
jgi:putative flavoprotein involved in K+ transport